MDIFGNTAATLEDTVWADIFWSTIAALQGAFFLFLINQ